MSQIWCAIYRPNSCNLLVCLMVWLFKYASTKYNPIKIMLLSGHVWNANNCTTGNSQTCTGFTDFYQYQNQIYLQTWLMLKFPNISEICVTYILFKKQEMPKK